MAAEQDFRPTLTRVRDSNPDGLVLLSYYADGALICRQARDAGIKLPIVAGTSNYSPEIHRTGRSRRRGRLRHDDVLPRRPAARRCRISSIAYRAKYDTDPDSFSAGAYDTIVLWAKLVEGWGPTREGMLTGLTEIKDVPSVIYGSVTFDQATRRVQGASIQTPHRSRRQIRPLGRQDSTGVSVPVCPSARSVASRQSIGRKRPSDGSHGAFWMLRLAKWGPGSTTPSTG